MRTVSAPSDSSIERRDNQERRPLFSLLRHRSREHLRLATMMLLRGRIGLESELRAAGGLATPALLAQVLVSKYCDHTPLYRQSQIFARHSVDLAVRPWRLGWRRVLVTEALHE